MAPTQSDLTTGVAVSAPRLVAVAWVVPTTLDSAVAEADIAKMAAWLAAYAGKIEVVFANNDDMALGAIDALEAAGKPLPPIVGVNAVPDAIAAIMAGKLLATAHDTRRIITDMVAQIEATIGLRALPAFGL